MDEFATNLNQTIWIFMSLVLFVRHLLISNAFNLTSKGYSEMYPILGPASEHHLNLSLCPSSEELISLLELIFSITALWTVSAIGFWRPLNNVPLQYLLVPSPWAVSVWEVVVGSIIRSFTALTSILILWAVETDTAYIIFTCASPWYLIKGTGKVTKSKVLFYSNKIIIIMISSVVCIM